MMLVMRKPRDNDRLQRFRYEAERYGYWTAAVTFSWRRAKTVLRRAVRNAVAAHFARKAKRRAYVKSYGYVSVNEFARGIQSPSLLGAGTSVLV